MGFKMLLYGMGATFSTLIIFYFVIKLLVKMFPKEELKN
jgi:hypothetical protein